MPALNFLFTAFADTAYTEFMFSFLLVYVAYQIMINKYLKVSLVIPQEEHLMTNRRCFIHLRATTLTNKKKKVVYL